MGPHGCEWRLDVVYRPNFIDSDAPMKAYRTATPVGFV
jgi:hypothetical protein